MLAHLLRAGLTPEVYALSKEVRTKKRVLRQRVFLVGIRTMVKNRVRVLLSQHGVKPPTFFGKKSLLWLKEEPELPEPDGWLLREEVELAETLKKIRAAEGLIKELAEGGGGGGVAQEPAGRGEFFSVLIRREVGEMERFPSPKKFASYTGLVPSTYASGKRITKEGNKWLRWAFIEAVSPAIRCSPYLHGYYMRIKARRGAKDARTATAKKLAELTWTVCTEKRPYHEE